MPLDGDDPVELLLGFKGSLGLTFDRQDVPADVEVDQVVEEVVHFHVALQALEHAFGLGDVQETAVEAEGGDAEVLDRDVVDQVPLHPPVA